MIRRQRTHLTKDTFAKLDFAEEITLYTFLPLIVLHTPIHARPSLTASPKVRRDTQSAPADQDLLPRLSPSWPLVSFP